MFAQNEPRCEQGIVSIKNRSKWCASTKLELVKCDEVWLFARPLLALVEGLIWQRSRAFWCEAAHPNCSCMSVGKKSQEVFRFWNKIIHWSNIWKAMACKTESEVVLLREYRTLSYKYPPISKNVVTQFNDGMYVGDNFLPLWTTSVQFSSVVKTRTQSVRSNNQTPAKIRVLHPSQSPVSLLKRLILSLRCHRRV